MGTSRVGLFFVRGVCRQEKGGMECGSGGSGAWDTWRWGEFWGGGGEFS